MKSFKTFRENAAANKHYGTTVYTLIDELDEIKAFSKYRNKNASYDDAFYKDIPIKLFIKHTKFKNVKDIENFNNQLKSYEGDVSIDNDTIRIHGGD